MREKHVFYDVDENIIFNFFLLCVLLSGGGDDGECMIKVKHFQLKLFSGSMLLHFFCIVSFFILEGNEQLWMLIR